MEASWEPLGRLLGASWVSLGASCGAPGAPRGPQGAATRPQEAPRTAQEPPQSHPKVVPKTVQDAPGSQKPPRSRPDPQNDAKMSRLGLDVGWCWEGFGVDLRGLHFGFSRDVREIFFNAESVAQAPPRRSRRHKLTTKRPQDAPRRPKMHQDAPKTSQREPNATHGGASEPRSGVARYRPSSPHVQDSFNPLDDLTLSKCRTKHQTAATWNRLLIKNALPVPLPSQVSFTYPWP